MQANKASTFVELWPTLNRDTKQHIARELIWRGYVNSNQTIYNWAAKRTRPATLAARRGVVEVVNQVLNANYDESLFEYDK